MFAEHRAIRGRTLCATVAATTGTPRRFLTVAGGNGVFLTPYVRVHACSAIAQTYYVVFRLAVAGLLRQHAGAGVQDTQRTSRCGRGGVAAQRNSPWSRQRIVMLAKIAFVFYCYKYGIDFGRITIRTAVDVLGTTALRRAALHGSK